MSQIVDHLNAVDDTISSIMIDMENIRRHLKEILSNNIWIAAWDGTPQSPSSLTESEQYSDDQHDRSTDEDSKSKHDNSVNLHISRGEDESYWIDLQR